MEKIDVTELRREIFVLNSHINRFDGKILAKLDLSPSQAKIIFLLSSSTREEVYPKNIDACLGMTHSTTSGILSRMKAKGLIEDYPSKKDKRRKVLRLTEKGAAAYQAFSYNLVHEDKLTKDIPAEQLEITCQTLLHMIKNMK